MTHYKLGRTLDYVYNVQCTMYSVQSLKYLVYLETGGGRCLVVTPSRETGLRLVQEARRLAGGTELIIR